MENIRQSSLKRAETCLICEDMKASGIYLIDQYICEECERRIVTSEPSDDFYKQYVRKLNKLNFKEKVKKQA